LRASALLVVFVLRLWIGDVGCAIAELQCAPRSVPKLAMVKPTPTQAKASSFVFFSS